MASRYVPPHLRAKGLQQDVRLSKTEESSPDSPSPALITRSLRDLAVSAGPSTIDRRDVHTHFTDQKYDDGSRSTLNDSVGRPGRLAYIMLFAGANPRWKSDCVIFAKTNLNLLPGYEAAYSKCVDEYHSTETQKSGAEVPANDTAKEDSDATNHNDDALNDDKAATKDVNQPIQGHSDTAQAVSQRITLAQAQEESGFLNEGSKTTDINSDDASHSAEPPKLRSQLQESEPVAVFEQKGRDTFRFAGWFTLGRVDFLQPRSQEVVKMLDQKWSSADRYGKKREKTRGAEEWEKSLKHRWAVIQMARMKQQPASPVVEHIDRDPPTEDSKRSKAGGTKGDQPEAEANEARGMNYVHSGTLDPLASLPASEQDD